MHVTETTVTILPCNSTCTKIPNFRKTMCFGCNVKSGLDTKILSADLYSAQSISCKSHVLFPVAKSLLSCGLEFVAWSRILAASVGFSICLERQYCYCRNLRVAWNAVCVRFWATNDTVIRYDDLLGNITTVYNLPLSNQLTHLLSSLRAAYLTTCVQR